MGARRGALVFDDADHGPLLTMVAGDGAARAIAWPGIGASHRSMHGAKVELLQVPGKSS